MRKYAIALIVLALAACGGGDDDGAVPEQDPGEAPLTDDGGAADDASGDDNGDGAIVSPQPAGQALVSVDGLEYTMREPGGLACTITDDAITFSFRIGDNEVTLGAGANLYDAGWLGNITTTVGNPPGEAGPVVYFPDLAVNGDGLTIDGESASYFGPMQKQPANDGSNPPPINVGDGTISATCP